MSDYVVSSTKESMIDSIQQNSSIHLPKLLLNYSHLGNFTNSESARKSLLNCITPSRMVSFSADECDTDNGAWGQSNSEADHISVVDALLAQFPAA